MPISDVTDTIETYKEELGTGARSNYFRVQVGFPAGLDISPLTDATRSLEILCMTAQIPGNKPIETEVMNFLGETFKIDNGKGEPEEGTFSFKNTENLGLRQVCIKWADYIQAKKTGIRTAPEDYKMDNVYIAQLNKNKEVIYQVQLTGFFITVVTALELSVEEKTVSMTEVTYSFDRYDVIE